MPSGCGRALIIPRELRVKGSSLHIAPIPETAVLRVDGSHVVAKVLNDSSGFAVGAQVELRLNCSGDLASLASGKIGVRVLETTDGSQFTELGYDFGVQAFYADHSRCCGTTANAIVQRAPLPRDALGNNLQLSAFVDGGVIEAFLAGRAITPLVAPDPRFGMPSERRSSAFVSQDVGNHGVTCVAESWRQRY